MEQCLGHSESFVNVSDEGISQLDPEGQIGVSQERVKEEREDLSVGGNSTCKGWGGEQDTVASNSKWQVCYFRSSEKQRPRRD